MNKVEHLNIRAAQFANIYNGDIHQRKQAGANYVVGLTNLEHCSPPEIASVIQSFTSHIEQFLQIIEDGGEPDDVKVRALSFPLATGFIALSHAARKQTIAPLLYPALRDDFLSKVASVSDFVNDKINIPNILDRLLCIAEDRTQSPYVKSEALEAFDLIADCGRSFGQPVNRALFSERLMCIGLYSSDKSMTETAFKLGQK